MDVIEKCWNSIPEEISRDYLNKYGGSSHTSWQLLVDVIQKVIKGKRNPSLLDVGCGNGNLLYFLREEKVNVQYTGVDYSLPLIEAGRSNYPDSEFLLDDVQELSKLDKKYTVAAYSHVIEMLSSPEKALKKCADIADTIIIRFFEPPVFEYDEVEIKSMDFGNDKTYYIRRKISKCYYQYLLQGIGVKSVHVYNDITSKDQVHVLYR